MRRLSGSLLAAGGPQDWTPLLGPPQGREPLELGPVDDPGQNRRTQRHPGHRPGRIRLRALIRAGPAPLLSTKQVVGGDCRSGPALRPFPQRLRGVTADRIAWSTTPLLHPVPAVTGEDGGRRRPSPRPTRRRR